MSKVILWLMTTSIYRWLLRSVIPYIRFTTYYASLRGATYHKGYSLLRPGHIILTTDKWKLTSLLIPGSWSHAALCVSKGPKLTPYAYGGALPVKVEHPYEIAEMTHTDYTKSHFFDLCKEADRVCILECVDFTPDYVEAMIARCLSFESARYDSEFTLGVEALYCSELIYQADFAKFLEVDLSDLAGLGRPYLSPDGIYQAENVRVVWDSINEWEN